MSLDKVPSGTDLPDKIHVIIEIPAQADPVKYEIDKESGALFVDRFMATCMHYPCNYGYIPHTLSDDGDPADVLVLTPFPLLPGSVVRCRPVGVLNMTDEAGTDAKIVAVPARSQTKMYWDVREPEHLPEILRDQIQHFFEHYKDLEEGKWVRIDGWGDSTQAKKEVMDSIKRYEEAPVKPPF